MNKLSSNRVEVIDVLRGVALLGIILVHYSGEFAGWSSTYSSPVNIASLPTATADSAVNFFLNLFLTNKSRALFGFLFGVGFYFQIGKASRNGYRIEGKFAKRMLMLFVIGALHAYLLWSGDILRMYAICGMLLLLVYKWKPKPLFVTAVICSVIVPAVAVALHYHLPYTYLTDEMKRQMYNGITSEQYTDYLQANLLRDVAINLDPYTIGTYLLPIFGNFIFGYWAAQIQLFDKLSANKSLLYRCLIFSGIAGIVCSTAAVRLVAKVFHATESDIPTAWRDVLAFPASFSTEAMAFFLMCGVIYLYQLPFWKPSLTIFTFAGRMTLTNYVMQSVFGVLFFYGAGLGFISHFGSSIAFFIGLAYFILQLWYSYLWLQHFTMGPIEFLWRSLLEGKWQSIRRAEKEVLAV